MPQRNRISNPMKASTSASASSNSEFVTVALFSGTGLLLSLAAIIMRLRGLA